VKQALAVPGLHLVANDICCLRQLGCCTPLTFGIFFAGLICVTTVRQAAGRDPRRRGGRRGL